MLLLLLLLLPLLLTLPLAFNLLHHLQVKHPAAPPEAVEAFKKFYDAGNLMEVNEIAL